MYPAAHVRQDRLHAIYQQMAPHWRLLLHVFAPRFLPCVCHWKSVPAPCPRHPEHEPQH